VDGESPGEQGRGPLFGALERLEHGCRRVRGAPRPIFDRVEPEGGHDTIRRQLFDARPEAPRFRDEVLKGGSELK